MGTEEQSEEFADYLTSTFERTPVRYGIWIYLGSPSMKWPRRMSKVSRMPENVQQQLQSTIERMVNEGCNGLICIML